MSDPDQVSTTAPAEAPTRATVSRRSAIGMLVGGVAVGAVGGRIGGSSGSDKCRGSRRRPRLQRRHMGRRSAEDVRAARRIRPVLHLRVGRPLGPDVRHRRTVHAPLKVIPVFTHDAWQGYGFGSDRSEGARRGHRPPPRAINSVGATPTTRRSPRPAAVQRPLVLHRRPRQRPATR